MSFYVTADNTKLYYEIEGEGQPVVFIHGWSGSHEHLAGVVQGMKDKYRCISYCHRGHGASDVPEGGYTIAQLARDLKELIDYLALKNVILVGHSMGGYTIYEYIKQFGCDNLKKIVILDMSPKVTCDEEWKFGAFGNYDDACLQEDLGLISQDLTKFMWKFWKLVLPDFAALPDSLSDLIAPGLKGVNHTLPLLALWHSMFTNDYRSVVPSITVPAAYILPENPIYPRGAPEYVKKNANAPVKIIEAPGCTHMSPAEKPAETAKEIIAFIEE
jgi:non-heme chloroperoxidase